MYDVLLLQTSLVWSAAIWNVLEFAYTQAYLFFGVFHLLVCTAETPLGWCFHHIVVEYLRCIASADIIGLGVQLYELGRVNLLWCMLCAGVVAIVPTLTSRVCVCVWNPSSVQRDIVLPCHIMLAMCRACVCETRVLFKGILYFHVMQTLPVMLGGGDPVMSMLRLTKHKDIQGWKWLMAKTRGWSTPQSPV